MQEQAMFIEAVSGAFNLYLTPLRKGDNNFARLTGSSVAGAQVEDFKILTFGKLCSLVIQRI